jgi:uncharacterized protein (DUF2147 family)
MILHAATSLSAPPSANPSGAWLVESGHGVVEIAECGDALCGRIVGIDREAGSPMPTDVSGRSQCGLAILANAKPDGTGTWFGEITNPRDGAVYQAKLWVDDNDNLHLRGYIGISLFGSTQVWHRFTGRLGDDCSLG